MRVTLQIELSCTIRRNLVPPRLQYWAPGAGRDEQQIRARGMLAVGCKLPQAGVRAARGSCNGKTRMARPSIWSVKARY